MDINGVHHAGLVVHDLAAAIGAYRRLGFTVPAPDRPTLRGEPVGAANTRIHLENAFLEIVGVTGDVAGARPVPLTVPDDRLFGVLAAIRAATANLAACLDRFEGLHILILDSPDLDRAAARLTASGVGHGGVHAIQRPVPTAAGVRMSPTRFLEIDGDDPGAPRGRVPEGRVGIAENTPADDRVVPEHANGAVALTGVTLCVPDADLAATARRYRRYLGESGPAPLTVTGVSALTGPPPPALPAFTGLTIAVRDLAGTRRHLDAHGITGTTPRAGELQVPAEEACGATITFTA